MNNLHQEKTDVVSVILDDHELLNAFADTLELEKKVEDFSVQSLGRFQKMRCYLWRKAKEIMNALATKMQVLAILAEYNFKKEEKKIQLMLIKKD